MAENGKIDCWERIVMTKFLLKKYVPNYENAEKEAVRSAVGRFSGSVGIAANLLLFIGKLLAGILSGSVSVMADALNNLSDASASILTLLGFRLAGKPADAHHPFGHARIEYLSGLAVSVMILVIGLEMGKSSVEKMLHPVPVRISIVTAAVLLASVGVKFWLYLFNRRLADLISSKTLLATAADSRNDCITTTAVLTASLIEYFLDLRVDGLMGLGVAVFILYSGIQLAKETINPLLGESADPELRQKIVDYICRQPKVLGYHDLMVHDYGPGQRFASIHVEMDRREDPLECHERIDALERLCLESHNIHLVIHYDPVITDDPQLLQLQELTRRLLQEIEPMADLHDFRMLSADGKLRLFFDVALPAERMGQKAVIWQQLDVRLAAEEPAVGQTFITFDIAM